MSESTAVSKMRVPAAVWLGLAAAVILDTVVQMIWKHAVNQAPESAGLGEGLLAVVRQPLFLLLVALFVAQFLCWMQVLAKADLSFAQPITAISFVTVAITSKVLFDESVGLTRGAGIALILAGIWFISGTNHRTVVPAAPASEPASGGTP